MGLPFDFDSDEDTEVLKCLSVCTIQRLQMNQCAPVPFFPGSLPSLS